MFNRPLIRAALQASRQSAHARAAERLSPIVRFPAASAFPRRLAQCQQIRSKTTLAEGIRAQTRKSPVLFPLAVICVLIGAGTLLVYAPLVYARYIVGQFHKFPEPVANKLRRALYYTNHEVNPDQAIKYYRQALELADELGMDPFSDEMLGVKIQVSAFYEKIQHYDGAIKVLEVIRRDCLDWVQLLGDKHWNDGKRTRVLAKTVAISVKLGELYSNQYIQDMEAAEEQLVWAVETVLKEKNRREVEGVKEGEGDWVSDEEFGNALVSLAHNYEEKNQHYLATPLFLQALSLLPKNTCHSVVLMNNVATSLAQQKPPPSGLPPKSVSAPTSPRKSRFSSLKDVLPAFTSSPSDASFPTAPAPSKDTLLAQSRLWAEKALTLSKSIPASERTEDCDIGCAVASYNLGEIAEMQGALSEALTRYGEAKSLALKVGFSEGVAKADTALRRLKSSAQAEQAS